MNRTFAGVIVGIGCVIVGCSSGGYHIKDDDQTGYATRGLSDARPAGEAAPTRTVGSGSTRPVIAIDGTTMTESTVWPSVAEAAGALVSDELILDVALGRACSEAGITITEADMEAERKLLMQSMSGVVGMPDPEQALERIRRERGLGPVRWKGLLKRSAMLRALVRDHVTVTEETIQLTYQLRYGPTYQARLIVTTSPQAASSASQRARAGEDFGALAAQVSTDSSAARGGVIAPINPVDTTWPLAVRQAVTGLAVGDVSDPIVVDGGYAVLKMESINTGAGAPQLSAVRTEMEQLARIEAERLAMQQEADQLRSTSRVEILDSSLGWGR